MLASCTPSIKLSTNNIRCFYKALVIGSVSDGKAIMSTCTCLALKMYLEIPSLEQKLFVTMEKSYMLIT